MAAGSLEDLKKGLTEGQRVILEVRAAKSADGPAEMARAAGQAAGVAEIWREDAGEGWTRLRVAPAPGADPREALYAVVTQRGWQLREMRATAPTLEELYVQVTAGEAAAAASGTAA
jgi:hypothetical protein